MNYKILVTVIKNNCNTIKIYFLEYLILDINCDILWLINILLYNQDSTFCYSKLWYDWTSEKNENYRLYSNTTLETYLIWKINI